MKVRRRETACVARLRARRRDDVRRPCDDGFANTLECDAQEGFDITALLGRACLLQIEHEDKGDRTFAKVANVMPLPAQTKTPPASTPLSFFSLEPAEFDAKVLAALPECGSPKARAQSQGPRLRHRCGSPP
jgi:hypothetical protein